MWSPHRCALWRSQGWCEDQPKTLLCKWCFAMVTAGVDLPIGRCTRLSVIPFCLSFSSFLKLKLHCYLNQYSRSIIGASFLHLISSTAQPVIQAMNYSIHVICDLGGRGAPAHASVH